MARAFACVASACRDDARSTNASPNSALRLTSKRDCRSEGLPLNVRRMSTRCILCNGPMEASPQRFGLAIHGDPDAICRSCRSLTGEACAALRDLVSRLPSAIPGSSVTRHAGTP
jgi:hypothetical protein